MPSRSLVSWPTAVGRKLLSDAVLIELSNSGAVVMFSSNFSLLNKLTLAPESMMRDSEFSLFLPLLTLFPLLSSPLLPLLVVVSLLQWTHTISPDQVEIVQNATYVLLYVNKFYRYQYCYTYMYGNNKDDTSELRC